VRARRHAAALLSGSVLLLAAFVPLTNAPTAAATVPACGTGTVNATSAGMAENRRVDVHVG
jgi:tetrahydromethanopterin S-methyltransferase subunit D